MQFSSHVLYLQAGLLLGIFGLSLLHRYRKLLPLRWSFLKLLRGGER